MTKSNKRAKTVNVPRSMAEQIITIIGNEELGFLSTDEFVRDAIRESILKYSQIIKSQKPKKEINFKNKLGDL